MAQTRSSGPLIGIVGPCGAGKTTLERGLQGKGFRARQIAQEHSYVPAMWSLLTQPDILVFLDASFNVCTMRKAFDWTPREYEEQQARLADARAKCHIFLNTDGVSPDEVLRWVLAAIEGHPSD